MWKIYAVAKHPGEPEFYPDLNVTITVSKDELVNEVKKVGVIIDRGMEI